MSESAKPPPAYEPKPGSAPATPEPKPAEEVQHAGAGTLEPASSQPPEDE